MHKSLKVFLFLVVFASFNPLGAQSQWAKTYARPSNDDFYSIKQTSDGGYIVAGLTQTGGSGIYDVWVLKLDPRGEPEWENTYGESQSDYAVCIIQTNDGGYALAGTTVLSETASIDILVMKLFPNGDVDWQQVIGGSDSDYAVSIQQSNDGGYVVSGYTYSFVPEGYAKTWLLKLTSYGELIRQKVYPYSGPKSFILTSDEGMIIAGDYNEPFLLKLGPDWEPEWVKSYGGDTLERLGDAIQAADGGYIFAGISNVNGNQNDIWILKLFPNGELDWQYTYGGDLDEGVASLVQTADGGIVVLGCSNSFNEVKRYDVWILKISPSGETIEWERAYNITGASLITWQHSIYLTSDGGFAVSGGTGSSYYIDGFVLKLSPFGEIDPSCGIISNTNAHIIMSNFPALNENMEALDTLANVNPYIFSPQNSSAIVTLLCQSTVPSPVIAGLNPSSGPVGTEVAVSGTNFGSDKGTVTFNGVSAPISSWTDTQIVTTVPSGATTGPVVVHTADGKPSNEVTFTITMPIPPPTISELLPESGPVGTLVTISGSNFGTAQGTITFNGVSASVSNWTDTQIVTSVPLGATTGPVVVHTSDSRNSNEAEFVVIDFAGDFVFPVKGLKATDLRTDPLDNKLGKWKGNGVGASITVDGRLIHGHLGQDYYLTNKDSAGEPVYAIANGIIVEVLNDPSTLYGWPDNNDHGWGPVVVIKHFHANGFKVTSAAVCDPENCGTDFSPKVVYSLYGHLSKTSISALRIGDAVIKGQLIGEIGKYGVDQHSWTTNHLHFEIKDEIGFKEGLWYRIHPGTCPGSSAYIVNNREIIGVGTGYSQKKKSAPHRYIPSVFIKENM